MKKIMLAICATVLSVGLPCAAGSRAETPFEIGLFTPCQIPFSNPDVRGVGIDLLWGRRFNAAGFQFGAIGNVIENEMCGLQIGFFNSAKVLSGLQIGLVNVADDGTGGIQIGVVNVMKDGRYPVLPVLNIGF